LMGGGRLGGGGLAGGGLAGGVASPSPSAMRAPDTKYADYVKPKEEASPRGAYSVPSTNHPPDDLIDDLSEEEID